MSVQPNLFGEEPAGDRLGTSQQAVLDAVREQSSLSADEAGAIVHARRGHHATDVRCEWCGRDGRKVLVSLRNHKLVKQVKSTGAWVLAGTKTADAPVTDPATSEWPQGF